MQTFRLRIESEAFTQANPRLQANQNSHTQISYRRKSQCLRRLAMSVKKNHVHFHHHHHRYGGKMRHKPIDVHFRKEVHQLSHETGVRMQMQKNDRIKSF